MQRHVEIDSARGRTRYARKSATTKGTSIERKKTRRKPTITTVPANEKLRAQPRLTSLSSRSDPSGLPSSTGIWKLVGVQVRLGDKLTKLYNRVYAATTWDYYRVAMREVSVRLRQRHGESTKIAFVVTAGGTMGDNSADVAEARKPLASEHVFFSPARDPYVDLAVLRGCDGLVIGGSSLGWWAAYLAKLPEARHLIAAMLVRNFEFSWPEGEPEPIPEQFVTVRPKTPFRVTLTNRTH